MNDGLGKEFDTDRRIERLENDMLLERFGLVGEVTDDEHLDSAHLFGKMEAPDGNRSISAFDASDALSQFVCMGFDQVKALDTEELGLLPSACGITLSDMDMVLSKTSLLIDRYEEASLEDLLEAISRDERVLCYIHSAELVYPNIEVLDMRADRLVEVCGIDIQAPEHMTAYICDPHQAVIGREYPLQDFLRAWNDAGNRMIAAGRED